MRGFRLSLFSYKNDLIFGQEGGKRQGVGGFLAESVL